MALSGGCVSNPAGGVGVDWRLTLDADGAVEQLLDSKLEDAWLARRIRITPMGLSNTPNGFMAMNTVESLAAKPLSLEYRIDWLDEDGVVIPFDFVLWHSYTLNPGDNRFLIKPFPPVAAGYRLTVRRKR